MEKLFKEGFTSMEALELIDSDDLAKTKIPRGQQKLILANVGKLLNSKASETGAQGQRSSSNVNNVTAEELPTLMTATCVTSLRMHQPPPANLRAPETRVRQSKMAAPML